MIDHDKVIAGLKACDIMYATRQYCMEAQCPYRALWARSECIPALHEDVLRLMEEQGDEKATGRLYECDPAKNLACAKTSCHIQGGECYRTTKKEYAKE